MSTPALFADFAALQDQLRGIWRFRWIALIVAWCVAVVAWILVFLIPNTYEASARIFVDTGTTLNQATKGISLNDNMDDQIERVTSAILGTPQLEKVANQTNLMAGAITPPQQQAVIENLRKNIVVTGSLAQRNSTAALFTISYKDRSRARAVSVVNQLLNNFVEGSLLDKNQGSEQAEQFLTAQIADYGRHLSATEQQLADFKRRNIGMVPGEQGDFFTRLQSNNDKLTQLRESLYVAQRKRDAIAQELKAGQQFTAGSSTPQGAGSAAVLDTEQQIDQLRQRLDRMLLKYTDKYPTVIALKATLKELGARQRRQLAAAQKGDVGAASALGLTANPVYQQLEERYNAEQVQIASLQQQISDRQQKIATLKAAVKTAPLVQAEYARLTRNYDVTKTQYDALLARLDSTRLGQQAASTGLVKFQVIDPPAASFKPVEPKRVLLIIATLFVALGAGVGVAYLLHLLRPVFVSARQLGTATGLTVLGAVSMAWVGRHRAENRQGIVRYACWTAALFIVAGAVLALHTRISDLVLELRA